jgi:superfamily II DNA or RNA helicase
MSSTLGVRYLNDPLEWVSNSPRIEELSMQLRDYQQRALDKIKDNYFRRNVRRQILSLPTGLGKTVIFARVHDALGLKKRVLVIAHRHELVKQAVKHFQALGYSFGVERTDTWYENVSSKKMIWIATVQSLAHPISKRVKRLSPDKFDLVICDEAHHSVAKSYLSVCDHFGITTNEFAGLFLGVTATPIRNDGKSLGQIFDEVVCEMDTFAAIEGGWLVDIKYFQAQSRIAIDDLPRDPSGDFTLKALGRRVNQDVRNSLIFKAWEKLAKKKKTIAFCATVEHAENVAKTFSDHGVSAQAVHGRLSPEERGRILSAHRNGGITLLANCEILTEGYDDPNIECIIMARPTQSQPLYIQMIGRGLRLPQGIENLKKPRKEGPLDPTTKTQCIIIDVVDNCARHDLEVVTALALFGESKDAGESSPDRVAPETLRPLVGRAPEPDVFKAAEPEIQQIDLFAHRKKSEQKVEKPSVRPPRAVTEGPLKDWLIIEGDEEYRRNLHRKVVGHWRSVPDESPCSFMRPKDKAYEVAISSCPPGRWTLSVKAANGTLYSRTFQNLFDAFGCAEYFVCKQTGEIDRFLQPPRARAVLPIQKRLLKICDKSAPEAQTFTEAEQTIVRCMKSK